MASQDKTQPPISANNQQQNALIDGGNSETIPVNQGSFMRVDDLEGRLRGLILKNNSSTTANAVPESNITNQSSSLAINQSVTSDLIAPRTRADQPPTLGSSPKVRIPLKNIESAAPVAKSPGQDGQASSPSKQQESSQNRTRRPNQAQRRQMGKVNLQDIPSASTKDARQPANRNQSSKSALAQSRQTQESQQTSNSSAPFQSAKAQHHLPFQDQQHRAIRQRQVQNHPAAQMPQHYPMQHTNYARGFVPSAGPHVVPFSRHASMAPQSMISNMQHPPYFNSAATHSGSEASQYTRPVVPNGRLYQGDMNRTVYNHRSGRAQHPDLNAQNAFVHTTGEMLFSKAKASSEEIQEKEILRLRLRKICAEAVSNFEKAKNPEFDIENVDLACFGSLRSGFATSGSDMDLALVSPSSVPDPASAESEIPRLLEKVFLDLGYGARLLTKTRVPIIRFCEKPTAELWGALRENRAKWEKEKDSPTKPRKAKDAKSKEEGKASQTGVGEETEVGTTSSIGKGTSGQASTTNPTTAALTVDYKEDLEKCTSDENLSSQAKESTSSVTSRTDEDLVHLYKLAIKEGWFEPSERLVIVKFIEAVNLHGANGDQKDLVDLRLQLEKLPDVLSRYRVPPESHLDYPKTGVGIQCDINFSNHLALHNTRLLRCYSLCDLRVQPMIIVVKAWAKNRKINSSYHGTLSSYGYVLMALHYLMNVVQPPIIPNLQLVPHASAPENDYGLNGYNVHFWQSEQEILEAARRGQLTHNHLDTVGSLLRGFFHYYAHPYGGGFSWATDVLSLRTPGGILRKEDKGWTGARTVLVESTVPGEDAKEVRHRYLFAIEDPFELEHNVARTVVHNGIVAIRDEFRRADKIIQACGSGKSSADGDLFAEAASKENLQRKFFGPLIKPFGAGVYQKRDGAPKKSTTENPNYSASSEKTESSEKQQGGGPTETVDGNPPASMRPPSSAEGGSAGGVEKIDRNQKVENEKPPAPVSPTLDPTEPDTPTLAEEPSTPDTEVSSVSHNGRTVEVEDCVQGANQ